MLGAQLSQVYERARTVTESCPFAKRLQPPIYVRHDHTLTEPSLIEILY